MAERTQNAVQAGRGPERTALHILPHPGEGGERYVDLLERMPGWRFERYYLSRNRAPAEALLRAVGARRAARRADLIHIGGDASAILALGALKARPGVISAHGFHLWRRSTGPRRRLVERRLHMAISSAAGVIASSDSELSEARALAGPQLADRVELIHNGIEVPPPIDPVERAAVRAELGIGEDEVAVIYAAQLERRKGPLDLLDALGQAQAGARLKGLVCGAGPLEGQVRERCAAIGAQFLGFRSDLSRLIQGADIFVLPSAREGMSLALLEAMGQGLAVVVSDGPGNPEAVGSAGVIVPYGDSESLALSLQVLASDPARRAELGAEARARVQHEFSAATMVRRTQELYERVLSQRGSG